MNTDSPFDWSTEWQAAAEHALRRFAAAGGDVEASLLEATSLPEDDTRDQLVNTQLHVGLRQTAATYTLWRDLLRDAGVEAMDPHVALLRSLTGTASDDQCIALCSIAGELNKACATLAQPTVREVLATPPGSRSSMAASLVRLQLPDELASSQFTADVTEHVRTDHPDTWTRLVSLATAASGVAVIDQWRAVTRELTRANDELLRHLNRRAEGGYPASDSEVAIVSALLETDVTRGGDGFLTVEADSDPWRDERGRVIHPLGLEQTGA